MTTSSELAGRVRLAQVRTTALSVDEVLTAISAPEAGGIGLFVGVVRRHDHDREVTGLDYTAHPSAADRLMQVAQAAVNPDVTAVAVLHRVGHLEVGDLAVVVGVSAAHRAPALEACRVLIDTLKQEVPIWKEQHFRDGSGEWVGLP